MKKFLLVFGLMFFSYTSFAAITITAPTSVSGDYNTQEDVNVQISSDIEDEVFRIRLIGGLTSADDINCVKSFTAAESCSFTVSHTVLQKKSTRIYVYAKDGGRAQHTILFDVAVASTRADLSTGISTFGHLVSGDTVDFGTLTVIKTNQTRVYVKNTGDQKTSAIDSLSGNYTGSTAYSIIRDTCQSKELEKDETCFFDVRVDLNTVIEGVQTGTVLVKAAGETVGTSVTITGDLSVFGSGGGSDIVIGGIIPNVSSTSKGQSFQSLEDFDLQEIDVYIDSTNLTGTVKVEIGTLDPSLAGGVSGDNLTYTGAYPGTIVGESATLDISTLGLGGDAQANSSDIVTFTFPNISITANTEYFFVITTSNTGLNVGGTSTNSYADGSELTNFGGADWYKLSTFSGNDRDLAFNIRGASSGGGQDLSSVDYFCTQAGVDESGYTSPTFCSGAGTAVELEYIADCFSNPTWCSLNTQSENSVRAATNGEFFAVKSIEYTQSGSFIVNQVGMTFFKTDKASIGTLQETDTATAKNRVLPISIDFDGSETVVSSSQLHAALDGVGVYTSTAQIVPDPTDAELTEAQLYNKYKVEIDACFANGGNYVTFRMRGADFTKTGTAFNYTQLEGGCAGNKSSPSLTGIGIPYVLKYISSSISTTTPLNFSNFTLADYQTSILDNPVSWNINHAIEYGADVEEYFYLKKAEIESLVTP